MCSERAREVVCSSLGHDYVDDGGHKPEWRPRTAAAADGLQDDNGDNSDGWSVLCVFQAAVKRPRKRGFLLRSAAKELQLKEEEEEIWPSSATATVAVLLSSTHSLSTGFCE